jgi:hypothetical protein
MIDFIVSNLNSEITAADPATLNPTLYFEKPYYLEPDKGAGLEIDDHRVDCSHPDTYSNEHT